MIRCLWIFAARHGNKHRRHRGIRRLAHAAASKPAIIGYTCITVGALVPPLLTVPAALPAAVSGNTGPVAASPWAGADVRPPGWEIVGPPTLLSDVPLTEFPITGPPVLLPDVPIAPESAAPPTLAPEVPTTPGQPVPEPSSLALLATAVAAFVAWRTR